MMIAQDDDDDDDDDDNDLYDNEYCDLFLC